MRTKTIKLIPTHFSLDVLITKSEEKAIKYQAKRYGISEEKLREEKQHLNSVCTMYTDENAELKNTTRILLILKNFDTATIVHEIVHVLNRTSELSGVELNKNSQEWQALFTEYLFNEITKKDNYKKH